MNFAAPHTQDKAARRAALARAAVMDLALCLMGLILFLQTQGIVWLIGGVILGTAVFVAALVKYVRSGARSAPKSGGANAKSSTNQHPAGSNVTPFRRPMPKKPPHDSNRTSA